MSEWKEYKLKNITSKIGSGATPRGGSNSYIEEGISLFRSQNILDFKFSESGLAFIDDNQADELKNVIVAENDILLNITGDSVARCCLAPIKFLPARVNQHVSIIRTIPREANFRFVFYYLQYLKPELLISAEIGATRNAITKGMIEEIDISLPELPEQRAIATVLSSLDDKIDLLHRQNATLEAMAETLFWHWFVEEAKEDWEEKPLIYFGNIICGKTPSKAINDFYNGDIPFIKIPDMHGNTFLFHTTDSLSKKGRDSQKNKTLPPKSICVSCIATVGLVSMNAYESQTNQQINSILPKKDIYRYYLFLQMKSSSDLLHAMASGGTATLNLNTGNFSQIPILLPDEIYLEKFHQKVDKLFEKIFLNQTQIRTLTALRDTLLPKLMSGEVRVEM